MISGGFIIKKNENVGKFFIKQLINWTNHGADKDKYIRAADWMDRRKPFSYMSTISCYFDEKIDYMHTRELMGKIVPTYRC